MSILSLSHWQLEWLTPELFETISHHYAEEQRHYHTLRHIDAMLRTARTCEFNLLAQWNDLSAAIVFHDIVYDPTAKDNEAQSAVLAALLLSDTPGIDTSYVASMIEATALHESDDAMTQRLIDIDMSILSSTPTVYHDYAIAIRDEYSHVPLDTYIEGRSDFLRKQLRRRNAIYYFEMEGSATSRSGVFSSMLHRFASTQLARQNMAAELGFLSTDPNRYLNLE